MRRASLLAMAVSVSFLAVACSGGDDPKPAPPSSAAGPVEVGAVAPDFSLPSASGGQETLSDYVGKPVLLYFSMGPG